MASHINNEVVVTNDTVYDLVYGTGTVKQVTDGSFSVVFPNKRELNYTTGGFYNGGTIQRVYWSNPIIAPPLKSADVWGTISDMVVSMVTILRTKLNASS